MMMKLVVIASLALATATMPQATAGNFSVATCEDCSKFVSAYSQFLKFGNLSSQASIEIGRKMCSLMDLGGQAQVEACGMIVNATENLKDYLINKMMAPSGVCSKLGYCNATNVTGRLPAAVKTAVSSCDEECKQICLRNGGGDACVHGCGCKVFQTSAKTAVSSCDEECKQICLRNGGGDACVHGCGCTAFQTSAKTVVSSCDEECKQTCLRNGGGDACVHGCGCGVFQTPVKTVVSSCDEECKQICLRNGGGDACVRGCGCKIYSTSARASSGCGDGKKFCFNMNSCVSNSIFTGVLCGAEL